jgi:hypothetical protein
LRRLRFRRRFSTLTNSSDKASDLPLLARHSCPN